MANKITLNQSKVALNTAMARFIENEYTMTREVLSALLVQRKDINFECGYPDNISAQNYRDIYEREGVARKVVRMVAEDCWSEPPEIYESKDVDETQFEKEWEALQKDKQVFQFMQRVDCLSGIGRFGILLLGLDDGKGLNEPVEGINIKTGEKVGNVKRRLLYLKALDESVVSIAQKETDITSPRYGQPIMYSIQFENPISADTKSKQTAQVHWTRVIHVCDNRESSDIYGEPRMKNVYNRLLDIRKILGGSGEMFWKGGFPGYTAEIAPELAKDVLESYDLKTSISDALKDQVDKYFNSMQRVLAVSGMTFKSLAPQVSDPTSHLEANYRYIAMAINVPYRIFMGTEEAKLASSQDVKTYNSRLSNRQNQYITPMLIRPLIDRFIAFGILPEPSEGYEAEWPKKEELSELDNATIVNVKTEALAKYVTGGVSEIVPQKSYLTDFLNVDEDLAETYLEEANIMEPPVDETEEEPPTKTAGE